jgi:hypothetical protein
MIDQSHIKNGIRNYGQHITFNSMKTPYLDTPTTLRGGG